MTIPTRPSASTISARGLHLLAIRQRHGFTPAGLIDAFQPRRSAGPVGVYNSVAQGLDPAAGPVTLVCEVHAATLGVASLTVARVEARRPEGWCERCERRRHR